jgi:nitrogen regulatory protein PII
MKRLDLILSERELDSILKVIDAAGAPGYSVIKHVTGRGPHGAVPIRWTSAAWAPMPT